jgi:predicted Ser/Thr protein kinase
MNDILGCPPPNVLQRLALGQLPDADAQRLEQHILSCTDCANRLNSLLSKDPVAAPLRSGVRQSIGDSPTAKAPIERLVRDKPDSALAVTVAPSMTGKEADRGGPKAAVGFLAPAQAPDEIGRLGRYRVLKVLGAGGMGVVFRAHDPQLERLVALKAMLPNVAAQPDARDRFTREAKAMAKLKDDHVVAIYDVDEDNGVPFLAMEYLQGESLDGWLKKGKQMSVGQVLRVGREIAQGLTAAHAKGLVHRDIKPANIWLEAPKGRVKILDFGLARGGAHDVQLTQSGAILGTPAYMAPEQGRGEAADSRSDLFSLGCVLYRLSTGKPAFEGPTIMAILTALATTNPSPVSEVNPQIPGPLAGLVMRLLAKRAEERPASAAEVIRAIQTIERQRSQAAPAEPAAPMPAATGVVPPAGQATHIAGRGESKDPSEKDVAAKLFATNPTLEQVASINSRATANVGAASAPPRRSLPWKWLAIGIVAAICVIPAAQLVIRIRQPDGSETTIEVPKGSTVIVEDQGKPIVEVPTEKAKAKPALVGEPHRRLAEMLLNHEGKLTVRTAKEHINVAGIKDLPKEPFLVAYIQGGTKPIPDQALEAFEGVHEVPTIFLTVADTAGVGRLRDVAAQHIVLDGEKLNGDECLKLLGQRPDLLKLTIRCSSLSNAAVPLLLRMKRLRELYLTGCSKLTDKGIKELATHPALTFVHIDPIAPEAAALFNRLPFLRSVNLDKVDDAAVTNLSGLTRAAAVVPGYDLSDDAARRLQKALPNAVVFHGANPPTEAERSAFQWALDQKVVFSGALNWNEPIKEVPTTAIAFGHLTFPDDVLKTGASHLRGIRCVHSLRWFGPQNADEEAEHLATLDSLLSLWLGRTTLTAKGMERLTALRRLEGLTLFHIPTLTTEALVPAQDQMLGLRIL